MIKVGTVNTRYWMEGEGSPVILISSLIGPTSFSCSSRGARACRRSDSLRIEGAELAALTSPPDESTDTRVVSPVVRSWTKMSFTPFPSAPTPKRSFAKDSNATYLPSELIDGL